MSAGAGLVDPSLTHGVNRPAEHASTFVAGASILPGSAFTLRKLEAFSAACLCPCPCPCPCSCELLLSLGAKVNASNNAGDR